MAELRHKRGQTSARQRISQRQLIERRALPKHRRRLARRQQRAADQGLQRCAGRIAQQHMPRRIPFVQPRNQSSLASRSTTGPICSGSVRRLLARVASDKPRAAPRRATSSRIAFGPRAGQKVLTLQGAMPREAGSKQSLCADRQGFSLHAAVRCAAGRRAVRKPTERPVVALQTQSA